MSERESLTVLGAGPAGLAVGWYATARGAPVTLLEARERVGGLARTEEFDGIRFDTGAHRLHDRDPAVTQLVRELLGDDLQPVDAPSAILDRGRWIRFPIGLRDVWTALPVREMVPAFFDWATRGRSQRSPSTLADMAVRRYGRRLARRFVLDYSEKLWGAPATQLTVDVAGARLRGLSVGDLLTTREPQHFEGRFLYPRLGIGQIAEALADRLGDVVRLRQRVEAVQHDGRRVTRLVVDGHARAVDTLVSTLPVSSLAMLLDPAPPAAVRDAVERLRFRNMVLVALHLDEARRTSFASIYVPSPALPFTRIVEPKNRSAAMAPADRTALVVEYPCFADDPAWQQADGDRIESTVTALAELGLLDPARVLGGTVVRLPHAYPVLDLDATGHLAVVADHLARYENLHSTGRSARFRYQHIHDVFRDARELVDGLPRLG